LSLTVDSCYWLYLHTHTVFLCVHVRVLACQLCNKWDVFVLCSVWWKCSYLGREEWQVSEDPASTLRPRHSGRFTSLIRWQCVGSCSMMFGREMRLMKMERKFRTVSKSRWKVLVCLTMTHGTGSCRERRWRDDRWLCVCDRHVTVCVCVCGWCLMLMVEWQACCHCSSTRAFLETWLWQHQDVVGSGSLLTETVWLWCLVAGQLQPWWLSHCLQQLWWTLVSRSDNCASYSLWFRSVICPQLVYVELSVIVNVDIIDVVVEFGTRRPGSASRRWLASVCVVWLYASVSIIITVFSCVLSHAPRAGSGAVSK